MVAFRRYMNRALLFLALCGVLVGCPEAPRGDFALVVTPALLDFGASSTELSFRVSRTGEPKDVSRLVLTPSDPWIVLESGVIEAPPSSVTVPVTIDRCSMSDVLLGELTGTITVSAPGVAAQTVSVTVEVAMVVDFEGSTQSPNVGQDVAFTSEVRYGGTGDLTWAWDFGDPDSGEENTSDLQNPAHTYAQAGIYTVSVAVSAGSITGCRTRTDYLVITEEVPPQAGFTASRRDPLVNSSVRFTDTSVAGSASITGWEWDFGDGGTSNLQNPVYVYAESDTYTVSLTVTSADGLEDTEVKADYITVGSEPPTADFVASVVDPLVNTPVQFLDTSTAGTAPIAHWEWNFGDGSPRVTERNPIHRYSLPGTYNVSLTVLSDHGEDTETKPGYITARSKPPTADLAASITRGVTIDVIAFTDETEEGTSSLIAWRWDFGDETASNLQNPTHTYTDDGVYTVSLTVTAEDGEEASVVKTDYITVYEANELDDYVRQPDRSYGYVRETTVAGPGYTGHILEMVSQTWHAGDVNIPEWRHWLTIIEPDSVSHDTAMLFISGGSNTSAAPTSVDAGLAQLAVGTESVIASLEVVPNEPVIFSDETEERTEDEIIAYTFDKYMTTGDPTWPLLLPMAKSAVRAMDTVQDFLGDRTVGPVDIDTFVVTGASKRGWTTWLTGATDGRVIAIAPMVIDVLNMDESMSHHFNVYGFYSEAIHDYEDMNIFERLDTAEGQALILIVDPFEYRERFENVPKLGLNSTGDEFFVPDSAQFYFDDLVGEKHLRYFPNTNHGLGGYENVIVSLAPWYWSVLNGTARPAFTWRVESEGTIVVETDEPPMEVRLWTATSSNRDFRMDEDMNPNPPEWSSTSLAASGESTYVASVPAPPAGWTGYLVELKFASGFSLAGQPMPYYFTTEVRMTPEGYAAGP